MQKRFDLILIVGVSAMVGFAVGLWLADKSAQIQDLQAQLAQLQKQRAPPVGPNVRATPWKQSSASSSPPGPARSQPADDDLSRLMTTEDHERQIELQERRQKGEYVLHYEFPLTQKANGLSIKKFVEYESSINGPEYAQMFSELGINPDVASQLQRHLGKIQKASLEAAAAQSQLLMAMNDYDKRLRSLLPEEQYSQYRQYEDSKPAFREFQKLQDFVQSENKSPLDPKYDAVVKRIIQEAQAYTASYAGGPYDPPVQPAEGKEAVLRELAREIQQIPERANVLSNKAAEADLPPEVKNLLDSYYSARLEKRKQVYFNIANDIRPGRR